METRITSTVGSSVCNFLATGILKLCDRWRFPYSLLPSDWRFSRSLAGVAVGILTCVNLGISPVFAVIVGLVLHDFKLLPAFIAAYIISFGIKFIEKKYQKV